MEEDPLGQLSLEELIQQIRGIVKLESALVLSILVYVCTYVIVVSWARVICLIFTPKLEGHYIKAMVHSHLQCIIASNGLTLMYHGQPGLIKYPEKLDSFMVHSQINSCQLSLNKGSTFLLTVI